MTETLNPYASQLGNRNAREVTGETPDKLRSLLQQLSPDGLERSYADGKWTARMILCHLADCEIAFGFRIRQALAEPNHVIQPFDQDAWALAYRNHSLRAQTACETFAAVRDWNLILWDSLPPEALLKPVRHPERGEMTIRSIIETMGGHDLNHLGQLASIASTKGL